MNDEKYSFAVPIEYGIADMVALGAAMRDARFGSLDDWDLAPFVELTPAVPWVDGRGSLTFSGAWSVVAHPFGSAYTRDDSGSLLILLAHGDESIKEHLAVVECYSYRPEANAVFRVSSGWNPPAIVAAHQGKQTIIYRFKAPPWGNRVEVEPSNVPFWEFFSAKIFKGH
jgi:hypothetical protein